MNYMKNILRANRFSLLTIYLYLTIYQVLTLASPFVLGKAIDGLLSHDWSWLLAFISIEIVANIFALKRMVFDTKVYTKLYNEIVLKYLKAKKHIDASKKIARVDMANMVIYFFEDAIPYYIMSIISMVGAAVFILVADWKTGLIVIGCLIPVCSLVLYFFPKINLVTRLANNHFEKKASMISTENFEETEQFFQRRRKLQVYRSNLQGKSWFALNNTRASFLAIALVVFTYNRTSLTQGEAIAMYSYINQFLISLMSIPVAMEIWSLLKDVVNRLNQDDELENE